MVRVLSCYHFRGQRIGRCEEASAVTVAGQCVVVGIEDTVNVYIAGHASALPGALESFDGGDPYSAEHFLNQNIPELGIPITFSDGDRSPNNDSACSGKSGSCSSSVSSIESDTEIKLSHTFATMDLINSITFNKKGNYLLCLEGRDNDNDSTSNKNCSIRVYFQWNKKSDVLQMRTRIAGVSPSTNDLEKPCLMMVEIPLTSPAIAASTCNLTGHLASLSAESIINIFSYRLKEVSGRARLHYPDFDRLCTVEIPGSSPLTSLSFTGNFISASGVGKVHVIQVYKVDKPWSPSFASLGKQSSSTGIPRVGTGGFGGVRSCSSVSNRSSSPVDKSKQHFDHSNKITYDPCDECVTVHLPSITKANRKRTGNLAVAEEYSTEIIVNKSRIIFSSTMSTIDVKDILRLSLPSQQPNDKVLDTILYPIRIKDKLGGVACVIGMSKEALVYHLSIRELCRPVRITNYSFTAPLVSFSFDSIFFHALTESGLETYTSRSICYALQDQEGFETFRNDCPLVNEPPCLVGIRPFVRVKFMAANESLICLLTCPETPASTSSTDHQSSVAVVASPILPNNPMLQDERCWTIYSLELPDVDMLFEDTMRVANTAQESQSDTYFTLLSELHLIFRACLNFNPDDAPYYLPRYRNLCKIIGLEFLKQHWSLKNQITESVEFTNARAKELLQLGVTYLRMSEITVQSIFSASDNAYLTQDPIYIDGIVVLIDILLSSYCLNLKETDKHNFSPSLSSAIVDFLSQHSPTTLVDLVIKVPFLRENQSTKLVDILKDISTDQGYSGKETVALILTLIASGGVDSNVRSQVDEILRNVNQRDLVGCLSFECILDKNTKHATLTDVAICLLAVNNDLPTTIISEAMRNHEISVSEVMHAFSKAVNLNSESQIQVSLAKALRVVLENFLRDTINGTIDGAPGDEVFDCNNAKFVTFNEDERHAALAVVRSYISDINFLPAANSKLLRAGTTENIAGSSSNNQNQELNTNQFDEDEIQDNANLLGDDNANATETIDIVNKNQIFGKIPSFVNFLLGIDRPGGAITPANTRFCPSMFSSKESMNSYIRLLSLLSSPCVKVEGVKDSVLTFVHNSEGSVKSTPLQLILQTFCEPTETAISILISRQPTTVLLYAKEMFEKSTSKWKMLVNQLKKRIHLNPDSTDSDMFSTIIESVYLHLANTLSLTELEAVLEKGSDDAAKFRSTCKRVELANTYANMVIQISNDYLQNHK